MGTTLLMQILVGLSLAAVTLVCAVSLARYGLRHRSGMLWICAGLMIAGLVVYLLMVENPLRAICNSIHSFFPSRGDFGETLITRKVYGQEWEFGLSVSYYLFHWLVLVYVLSIILSFFGIGLVNWILIYFRLKWGKKLNVFWDYSNEAWLMANSIKDADGRSSVVFALREGHTPWFSMKLRDAVHALALEGWKWVYGAPGRIALLNGATQHFFLGPNGHENVAGAESLIRILAEIQTASIAKDELIKIYVRVHSLAHDDIIFRWVDSWNMRKGLNVEVVVLREESIVSRDFLFEHPMLDCPDIVRDTEQAKVEGKFKILLVGFGAQGRTLLNDMICDAQYLNREGKRLLIKADVVDKDVNAYGDYKINSKCAVDEYGIAFHEKDIKSEEFWSWIQKELAQEPWNRIVICIDDDRVNIAVATDIIRHLKWLGKATENRVFARVRNRRISAYTKQAMMSVEKKNGFCMFGCMDDTYRVESIINDKWEKGAKMLNDCYGKIYDPNSSVSPEERWHDEKFFNRESSRASFFFQRNLLRLMGYIVDKNTAEITSFVDDRARLLPTLARVEHLRWTAWHLVRSIRQFPKDLKGKSSKANQIESRNAHGDLVTFDALPAEEQKKDEILVITEVAWEATGLGIRKE